MPVDKSTYNIVERAGMPVLVVKGRWHPDMASAIAKRGVRGVVLSGYAGWRGTDLSFLNSMPGLERVEILAKSITDISPLYELKSLAYLSIDGSTPMIDFRRLKSLETVALGRWSDRSYDTLYTCKSIRKLVLTKIQPLTLTHLSELPRLENLSITYSAISDLSGLPRLARLTRLSVVGCSRLQALRGLMNCTDLIVLWVEQARSLSDVSEIATLARLRTLILKECPNIQSIAAVAGLQCLETVGLMQTTNIQDGDLIPLGMIPKLRNATFINRKHYNKRSEDFPKHLPAYY